MLTPKALQAWLTLLEEATKGTQQAQDAFKTLPMAAATPDAWQQWMNSFIPALNTPSATTQPEAFEAWLEEWWQMMGVVPRSRYLELLERHEQTQLKLDKAQATIATLQNMLNSKEQHQEDAKKVVDMWGTMLEETVKTQGEWMRAWGAKPSSDE